METVLVIVLLMALVGVVIWLSMRSRPSPVREGVEHQRGIRSMPGTVVLDVEGADPSNPYVERLVADIGHQALAEDEGLDHVIVVDRDGNQLGRVERPSERPPAPDLPAGLGGHLQRRTPSPVRSPGRPPTVATRRPPGGSDAVEDSDPSRPFAERFDLPPAVIERIQDPDWPLGVVRAILEAGGHRVDLDGDVLRVGEVAVLVIGSHLERPADAMSAAFLHYQASGARRGIVISLGFNDPTELHRRELLAPQLRHTGPEAIQRMAAAVAIGADPLRFALGLPTSR